jgi:hypothetical protein
MTMKVGWQELYQAALLELRPDELRRRIDDAEKAIQQRIVELSRNDSSSEEERRAMDDALRGLRVLASAECKPRFQQNLAWPKIRRHRDPLRSLRVYSIADIRFRASAADSNFAGASLPQIP